MRLKTQVSIGVLILALAGGPALADDAAIKKSIDTEFQPSTLSKDDQTEGAAMVRQSGGAVQGYGDQRGLGNPDRPQI